MANSEFISTTTSDGIATITMNRPPLNVLNIAMMAEFNDALETILADRDLVAVVIRGEGKAFSAGVDIADHTADRVGEMIGRFHGIFRKLASTDALTIAVVQGAALGGGCELACFCDIVLASDRAKFGQPEVRVGVFPPVAACIFPRQIGIRKAVELTALGAMIDAAEAHRIGLVSQLYPADEFASRVDAYLDDIRTLSRPVVRMAKRVTVSAEREEILAALDRAEGVYLDEMMKLSDAHEGLSAFMEKRKAVWTHA